MLSPLQEVQQLNTYTHNHYYGSGGGGGAGGVMIGRRWLSATPNRAEYNKDGGDGDGGGGGGHADEHHEVHVERKKTTKMAKTIKTLRDTIEEEQHNLNYVDLLDDDKKGDGEPSEPWLARAGTKVYWSDMWGHVKLEARHYWYGAKLLVADTKIAGRFLVKALRGQQLTRRERKQFTRTMADLVRLVPFVPFVIIPGAELLLPFAIKIFPNMLPTQFRHADTEMKKQRANLRVRIEMAKFLQETVEEMAVTTSKKSSSGADKKKKKNTHKDGSAGGKSKHGLAELAKMFEEGRTHARDIPTTELLKFSKLFDDVLTLDSLSHAHLVAYAKLLGLPTMGTSAVLNFQIRMQLRTLRADDFLILKEGIETMSVPGLQDACRARGMRAAGISEEGLRGRLSQWIKLHIVEDVPASLLLMSRVLYLPENLAPEAQLATVLDSLPENIKDEVKVAAAESEAIEVEPEAKLALLANEEALIEEELLEQKAAEVRAVAKEEAAAAGQRQAELDAVSNKVQPGIENEVWEKYTKSQAELDIDAAAEAAEAEEAERVLEAKVTGVTAEELQELVADVVLDEKATRAAIETLREDLEEDYALIREAKALELEFDVVTPKETKRLMKQVDYMVSKLENTFEETLKLPDGSVVLDANGDGVVSREELVMAFKKMDKTGEVTEAQIRKTVMLLDGDDDGSIPLQTIEKVIDMIVEEGDKIDATAIRTIVEVVEKEHKLEQEIAKYADDDDRTSAETNAEHDGTRARTRTRSNGSGRGDK